MATYLAIRTANGQEMRSEGVKDKAVAINAALDFLRPEEDCTVRICCWDKCGRDRTHIDTYEQEGEGTYWLYVMEEFTRRRVPLGVPT